MNHNAEGKRCNIIIPPDSCKIPFTWQSSWGCCNCRWQMLPSLWQTNLCANGCAHQRGCWVEWGHFQKTMLDHIHASPSAGWARSMCAEKLALAPCVQQAIMSPTRTRFVCDGASHIAWLSARLIARNMRMKDRTPHVQVYRERERERRNEKWFAGNAERTSCMRFWATSSVSNLEVPAYCKSNTTTITWEELDFTAKNTWSFGHHSAVNKIVWERQTLDFLQPPNSSQFLPHSFQHRMKLTTNPNCKGRASKDLEPRVPNQRQDAALRAAAAP